MRIEICIALLASTALHAGLIAVVPAALTSREPAAQITDERVLIIARLKNTLATGKTRSRDLRATGLGRAAASAGQPRIDNPRRFYPPEAVAKGLEGEAILLLRYGADGALIDARIAKSSGHAILDAAALRAVRATPRVAGGPREVLFPVAFELH